MTGWILTQSLAIIEYLNDTHGGLLPVDAPGRARVRALSYAVAMEIAPICNLSVRNHVASLTGGAFTADDWQRHYIGQGAGRGGTDAGLPRRPGCSAMMTR